MGRDKKDLDLEVALDLIMRGEKAPAIAAELGITPPTLRARIQEIQRDQALILQYREVRSLQLTSIQAKILENITPEKIEEASLRDLVQAYKILSEREQVFEGKPSEIKGLVAHLIHLEKQEAALATGSLVPGYTEIEFSDTVSEDEEDNTSSDLSDLDTDEF